MPQGEKNDRIEEQATSCVESIIKDAGYCIWDVIFEKEGAMWYLRVLFDTPEGIENPGSAEQGISSEECERLTAPINSVIDKQKFIDKIDILEIGSPGLTRKLRKPAHFKAMLGKPVCAALRNEKGKTVYKKGLLDGYDEESGEIKIENEKIVIKKCIKINLDL